MSTIEVRLRAIEARVAAAHAKRRARDPNAPRPRIIAVSKRHPEGAIEAAYAAGMRDFGENYAQEFRDKAAHFEGRAERFPALRWHFIGQLQRNKIKYVLGRALIHTVDRPKLVEALEARAAAAGVTQAILLEVNAGEAQKGGVSPAELPGLLDRVAGCEHLRCEGLMTMAPLGPPSLAADAFARVAELHRREAEKPRSGVELRELSMGMSGDFELAVEHGATMLRIGTAIFGARPT